MNESKTETIDELKERVMTHLRENPNSSNRQSLLGMHSFFTSNQPRMTCFDNVYARCARSIIYDRIDADEKEKAQASSNQPN